MANKTYDNPRAGSNSSKNRMQSMIEKINDPEKQLFKLGEKEIISRMYNPRPVSVGEKLGFQIDVNKVHFFDYETEKAI